MERSDYGSTHGRVDCCWRNLRVHDANNDTIRRDVAKSKPQKSPAGSIEPRANFSFHRRQPACPLERIISRNTTSSGPSGAKLVLFSGVATMSPRWSSVRSAFIAAAPRVSCSIESPNVTETKTSRRRSHVCKKFLPHWQVLPWQTKKPETNRLRLERVTAGIICDCGEP